MTLGPAPERQTPPTPGVRSGGLVGILRLVVLAAGVLVALLAFADFYDTGGFGGYNLGVMALPLVAGLVAGVALLPMQEEQQGIAAAVALAGFIGVLFAMLEGPTGVSLAVGAYLTFLATLIQAVAAAFALLLHAGVVSAPKPGPAAAQYGPPQGYAVPGRDGPPGQFGAPAQYGSPSEYGPSARAVPPGQYGGPVQAGTPEQHGAPAQYGSPSEYGPSARAVPPGQSDQSFQYRQQGQPAPREVDPREAPTHLQTPPVQRSYDPPTQVLPGSTTGVARENGPAGPDREQ